MDTLEAMRVFTAVVEAGSFSAAAKKCGISKAMTSKWVSRLEQHLNTQLLYRTTRSLSLTVAGQTYAYWAKNLVDEVANIENRMRDSKATLEGTIRFSAPWTFGNQILMPAFTEFCLKYPDIRLKLVLMDQRVELVSEGIDVGVFIGRLEDSSLVVRRVGDFPHVLAAAPAYLEKHPAPESPMELKQHSCIVDRNIQDGLDWTFRQGGYSTRIRPEPRLEVNGASAIRTALLAGLGLGICPWFTIREDLLTGNLVRLMPTHDIDSLGVYIIYPPNRHISSKVRKLVEFLMPYILENIP